MIKIYKNIIVLVLVKFILCGFFNNSYAQDTYKSVVYMKNGNVFQGKVIDINVNQSITIIDERGNERVLLQSDIEKIEKSYIKNDSKINYTQKGSYVFVSIGLLVGNGNDFNSVTLPLSFMFINGYQFDSRIGVGGGVGFELLNKDETYVPVFADFRYTISNARRNHFVSMQSGYVLSLDDSNQNDYVGSVDGATDLKTKGGFFLNPTIGLKINLTKRNAFSFEVGFRYMEIFQEYKKGQELIKRKLEYNRMNFRFGYHF
ncbi:MAG: hypothetical protein MI739_04075 [Bacteroidales bacterium]|nr:hypothetical protein [Bacteroidales bacterium]